MNDEIALAIAIRMNKQPAVAAAWPPRLINMIAAMNQITGQRKITQCNLAL